MAALDRMELGRLGEQTACRHLEGLGFGVLERNYRTAAGEVDIIARKGDLVVFVEVKTRRSAAFGEPEESVTPAKARRIRALASEYLAAPGGACEVRFDVVSVLVGRDGAVGELRHLEGAF